MKSFFTKTKEFMKNKWISLEKKIVIFRQSFDKEKQSNYAIKGMIALAFIMGVYQREALYDFFMYCYISLVRAFGSYEKLMPSQNRQLIVIRRLLYLVAKHGRENYINFERMHIQKSIREKQLKK